MSKKMFLRWCGGIALAACCGACGRENVYDPPPPPKVTVAEPLRHSVTTYREFTGRTAPYEEVELRARVPGFLAKQHYVEGAVVEAGAPMFTIERKPYEIALEAAQARLADARATLGQREFDYNRLKKLYESDNASETEFVNARAAYEGAKAAVQAAEAAVRQAELDLSYTEISAPIGGHASRALVEIGDLVGQGTPTLLSTVVRWDPMYVYFTVSERDVLEFRRSRVASGEDDGSLSPLPVYLRLSDGTEYGIAGALDYADSLVDPATGTVEVRAVVDNPEGLLVPGVFARVRIPRETQEALLVPQVALQRDLVGHFLLVVDDASEVSRVDVVAGEEVGVMRVIAEGLTGSERVIVKGLQRARPGATVRAEVTELSAADLPAPRSGMPSPATQPTD